MNFWEDSGYASRKKSNYYAELQLQSLNLKYLIKFNKSYIFHCLENIEQTNNIQLKEDKKSRKAT